jgi:hypothetical protein
MPWYEIVLSIDEVDAGHGERLMNELDALFLVNGDPSGAAVFINLQHRDGGLSHYYFNPEASALCAGLLAAWSAKQCPDPGRDVALLIGAGEAPGEADLGT